MTTSKPKLLSSGNPQIPKGDGDGPVQSYIAAMPGWKRDVGRRLDALIERTVPNVRKAVRWNTPFYGVAGKDWFLALYCYTKKVQVTFLRGASLQPVPPIESKHPQARYLDLHEDEELDEALIETWVRQASELPGDHLFEQRSDMQPNPEVDAFVSRAKTWSGEIRKLRSTLLECGLEEALKWGKPCFMKGGKNVAIIQPFKQHCALMFFKGALLEDTHGLLRSQGENTQSALRLEFTSEADIKKTVVKSYVKQAIAVEQSGRTVDFKAKCELEIPSELTQILKRDRKLARAFDALTPGRQRGYVMHFTGAKQSKTRTARIEKCIPKILAGKGLHDR